MSFLEKGVDNLVLSWQGCLNSWFSSHKQFLACGLWSFFVQILVQQVDLFCFQWQGSLICAFNLSQRTTQTYMSVMTSKPLKVPTIERPITFLATFLATFLFLILPAIWFKVEPEPTASSIRITFLNLRWSVTAKVFSALRIRSSSLERDFCGTGIMVQTYIWLFTVNSQIYVV